VREVLVDDETMEATVVVPDDQLSLAIGKEGLNARLAARLTGWKVDIVSETEFARSEAEAAFGGGADEEFTGRCAAVLSTGKRCPNTSIPGSRYCGIPAHRELAAREEAGEELDPSEAVPVGGFDEEPEAQAAEAEEAETGAEEAAEAEEAPVEAAAGAEEEEQPAP
jgi:N utilization substance protein A